MSENILLKIENISKNFPGVKALNNVSFDVCKGEVHAIVGENGAGKSTLMNILSGLYTPDEGKLILDNSEVSFRDPKHAQELGIAMIHQELSLAPHMSVLENIFLGRMKTGFLGLINYKEMYTQCKKQLEYLGISNISPDTLIKDLSVSEMQMVEIAKALSLNARIIIMDEPTSSITNKETEKLFATIRSLQKSNVSILYISHRMEEIFKISNNVTVLRDGTYIRTLKTSNTDAKEIVSLMVGREFTRSFSRECKLTGINEKPIMEVNNLAYGTKVKDVSFKLYPGEILALTGLVGAGRSEVVQTIFGINRMDKGEILLNGEKVKVTSPVDMIKLGVGLVPEGRKTQGLFLQMKVKENITMTNLPKLTKFNFINHKKESQVAKDYVKQLRVKTTSIDQQVQYLSGGNQQKTIIARWLLNKPKVLFLDEPTHGVDVGAKSEIYEIINNLATQGVSIVLISSELPEVLTLADRILVMHNGLITGELCRTDANQEIIMEYATNQMNNKSN